MKLSVRRASLESPRGRSLGAEELRESLRHAAARLNGIGGKHHLQRVEIVLPRDLAHEPRDTLVRELGDAIARAVGDQLPQGATDERGRMPT